MLGRCTHVRKCAHFDNPMKKHELDLLRAQVAQLKQSASPQAKTLAAQLERALASVGAGKAGSTNELLASVRATLSAVHTTLDENTEEGREAAAALGRATAAVKALPADAKALAGFTRALTDATTATKKAGKAQSAPTQKSFKVRPGTRRS